MSAHLEPGRSHSARELARVLRIEEPHRSLLTYYALSTIPALVFPPVWPFTMLLLYFRYHTMRYRFDAEGVTMRWGILFRREVTLAYARIQDIHLTSNVVERWLGLARIQISTASGSAAAEMTIEGLKEYELVRDFLYTRMRGAAEARTVEPRAGARDRIDGSEAQLVDALRQVSQDLRDVGAALGTLRKEKP